MNKEQTIEERAKEYASNNPHGNAYNWNAHHDAYIDGASDQKAIDIDKAIAWLSNYDNDYFPMIKKGWQGAFRKAMEE